MRLVTFEHQGRRAAGELRDDQIAVLRAPSVRRLILDAAAGAAGLAELAASRRSGRTVPVADVRLLPPVGIPPRNIFAVGWNYVSHFEEGDAAAHAVLPDHPTFFTKSPHSVIGPHDDIRIDSSASESWDYEAEVAIVIGGGGRDIAEADAMDQVAGYLLANDVTVRDHQRRHGGQWFKGKSFDATCPVGPALVTPDELTGPIEFMLAVDGEELQHGTTASMYFSFSRIVAELSAGLTLDPGDIVLGGTPEGVGYVRTPPRWLRQAR